jgi:deoxyribodipyrimidine photo-lyase
MSRDSRPILLWFRRDLRLADHPAMAAAAATGRPVIPLWIDDEVVAGFGAAPRFRTGLAVEAFARALATRGSRLILRRGPALDVLERLVAETGAGAVWWTRAYDPAARTRDTAVKAALNARGLDARSFPGLVIFEPWDVVTGTGGFYRVYTPFWKAVRDRDAGACLPAPARIAAPDVWPTSAAVSDLSMGAAMNRGAGVAAAYQQVGEAAAQARLESFMARKVGNYRFARDFPAVDATSGLSENLTYGEISARACWHAGWMAHDAGQAGAEHFFKELVWREFAHHLVYHTPGITSANWKPDWDAFPWNTEITPEVRAWQQGRTGLPFVDAAMRQMYVTGTMHNRGRMIVASYLTKHLMTHWKIGLDWFAHCLTDWDPASNAMGWQWIAGSGPDAAPYFRIFNPESQLLKFDPDLAYPRRWIAEGQGRPHATALSYFDAIPLHWALSPTDPYPAPVVSPEAGRARALAAYAARSA